MNLKVILKTLAGKKSIMWNYQISDPNRVQLYTSYFDSIRLSMDGLSARKLVALVSDVNKVHKLFIEHVMYSDGVENCTISDSNRILFPKAQKLPILHKSTEEVVFQLSLVLPNEISIELIAAIQKKTYSLQDHKGQFSEMVWYDL